MSRTSLLFAAGLIASLAAGGCSQATMQRITERMERLNASLETLSGSPRVELAFPEDGAKVPGGSLVVEGLARDTIAIVDVAYSLNAGAERRVPIVSDTLVRFRFRAELAAGRNAFVVKAKTSDGRVARAVVTVRAPERAELVARGGEAERRRPRAPDPVPQPVEPEPVRPEPAEPARVEPEPTPTPVSPAVSTGVCRPQIVEPAGGPAHDLVVKGVPATMAEPRAALRIPPGRELPLRSARRADGALMIAVPYHPDAPFDGGQAGLVVSDGADACDEVPLWIPALAPAPGTTDRMLADLESTIEDVAGRLGVTPAQLAGDPAGLPADVAPLAFALRLLDHPDNPNSVRALLAGTAPIAGGAQPDVRLIDALLAATGAARDWAELHRKLMGEGIAVPSAGEPGGHGAAGEPLGVGTRRMAQYCGGPFTADVLVDCMRAQYDAETWMITLDQNPAASQAWGVASGATGFSGPVGKFIVAAQTAGIQAGRELPRHAGKLARGAGPAAGAATLAMGAIALGMKLTQGLTAYTFPARFVAFEATVAPRVLETTPPTMGRVTNIRVHVATRPEGWLIEPTMLLDAVLLAKSATVGSVMERLGAGAWLEMRGAYVEFVAGLLATFGENAAKAEIKAKRLPEWRVGPRDYGWVTLDQARYVQLVSTSTPTLQIMPVWPLGYIAGPKPGTAKLLLRTNRQLFPSDSHTLEYVITVRKTEPPNADKDAASGGKPGATPSPMPACPLPEMFRLRDPATGEWGECMVAH